MSETTDSGQNVSPEPTGGAGGDQPNSFNEDALVTKLMDRLLPEIDKRVQSTKDRRFSKVEKEVANLRSRLKDEMVQEGVDPQEAEQIVAERLPESKKAPERPQTVQANVGSVPELAEVEKTILELAGIPEDDPDIVAFNQRPYANSVIRMRELQALAKRRVHPANPAAVAPAEGKGVAGSVEIAELDRLAQNPNRTYAETARMRELLAKIE